MLTIPAFCASSTIAYIVGIDPGTHNLGVAIIAFDVRTMTIVSTEAFTFVGAKLSKNSWETRVHGDKLGRIYALEERLFAFFRDVNPLMVASEAPFMSNAQPSAFMPLVEMIHSIRNALRTYDPFLQLYLYDPPSVKKAVGAPPTIGGERGKNNVKQRILAMSELNYRGEIPLDQLSEHAIDAIAVAYRRWLNYLEDLCLLR